MVEVDVGIIPATPPPHNPHDRGIFLCLSVASFRVHESVGVSAGDGRRGYMSLETSK